MEENKDFEKIIDTFTANNTTIDDIERLTNDIIHNFPKIDRNALRQEMGQMIVAIPENPTTFEITQGLAKSQGYRDRLTEIYIQIMKETKIRKRCLEMLFDATNLVSKASSADKRKGEATLRFPMQILQYESADSFLKEVEQILNNMKSIFDTFSRSGSMLALQVQLGEYKSNKINSGFEDFETEAEETEKKPIQQLSWN